MKVWKETHFAWFYLNCSYWKFAIIYHGIFELVVDLMLTWNLWWPRRPVCCLMRDMPDMCLEWKLGIMRYKFFHYDHEQCAVGTWCSQQGTHFTTWLTPCVSGSMACLNNVPCAWWRKKYVWFLVSRFSFFNFRWFI